MSRLLKQLRASIQAHRSGFGTDLASAIVIGFNVPCSRSIQNIAAATGVDLQLESVIYRLIETVRAKTAALLPPRIETRITGEATVLQLFPISVKRKESVIVAGCRVGNGTISRNEGVKILRGPERSQIYEGKLIARNERVKLTGT